jgi:hypothetical protein
MIIADRKEFYKNNLNQFIKDKNSRILVIGSGELDKIIFQELGYKNFTLSNINNNDNILDCIHQNSYNLNISDNSHNIYLTILLFLTLIYYYHILCYYHH